ncbi:hypothetical protein [Polyangium sp. y55x31]|uniref:hypothetical protein n=1 Tax=Polyangium sp. y55x31 TaxID=3042688 RepID=UPI002482822B|nr:hypothetical protein [Polyangium sp. y55x31]MDI1484540.1 hypothetical protein [Polyangium sp. y55x31]
MSLSMPLRAASSLALTLSALLFAGATGAGSPAPKVERVDIDGPCGQSVIPVWGVDVIRWTPDRGPPARFVADTYLAEGPDVFIALGVAQGAFWAIEGVTPNDACDDCALVDLVATSLVDGNRRVFHVLTEKDRDALVGGAQADVHARVLGRLFQLANGPWPAAELKHDYSLRLPERSPEGLVKQYQGWLVEVKKAKQWGLRFGLKVETVACWCTYAWETKKLSP